MHLKAEAVIANSRAIAMSSQVVISTVIASTRFLLSTSLFRHHNLPFIVDPRGDHESTFL